MVHLRARLVDTCRTQLEHRRNQRMRARGGVEALPGGASVLFVCYGNINRSALAHRYLEQLAGTSVNVDSCGLHTTVGRSADPRMVEVAASHGVDLSGWSSRVVTVERLCSADLVLGMESWHLARLRRMFPAVRSRACLLGACSNDPIVPLEISDPFGREMAAYETCFQQVGHATRHLVEALTAT
jgi:protein-tyrosine-phosphatase